ncbi:unnamed protein product [Parnassius apollo]|uniref:(apollo) hypothetical protein n=1 Tax=Parnassius apollo TaxID=110799 RepID=A0A8S3Y6S2_PARAO|nr:unnamed protein product [Parnassius apollo]
MDLTTRRGEEGSPGEAVLPLNGTEAVCRELVNGTQGCEVTGLTAEVPAPPRKSSSFSIRNLVGAEDTDHKADGNAHTNDITEEDSAS